MLFLARSPSFLQAARANDGVPAMLHKAAKASQRPWFVLTYLLPDPPTSCWETACAQELDVLVKHMKQRPNAQVADLLYMSPRSVNEKWTRHRIACIEQGKHDGASVNVYNSSPTGSFCFDHPQVDAEDVRGRKRVLDVHWWRYFNN